MVHREKFQSQTKYKAMAFKKYKRRTLVDYFKA